MKLPDYLKCVEVKDLLIKMGIQEIPKLEPVTFVREVTKTRIVEVENPQLSFGKRLELGAVPLAQANVVIGNDGIIEVNGIKACAYIKKQRQGIDHYNKTSTYRYHLCNCQTIERMIAGGRKDRYVSTTRSDGWFPVIDQSGYRAREVKIKLELCMNCRAILGNKRMLPNPYSLKSFFDRYQPEIPRTIKKTEQVITQEKYAPNHEDVARRFKEQVKHICQSCGVDCTADRQCLHLHHKDGDGQNNNASNLSVLCTACHARQFNHSHMPANPKFSQQIRSIAELRKSQDITALNYS